MLTTKSQGVPAQGALPGPERAVALQSTTTAATARGGILKGIEEQVALAVPVFMRLKAPEGCHFRVVVASPAAETTGRRGRENCQYSHKTSRPQDLMGWSVILQTQVQGNGGKVEMREGPSPSITICYWEVL